MINEHGNSFEGIFKPGKIKICVCQAYLSYYITFSGEIYFNVHMKSCQIWFYTCTMALIDYWGYRIQRIKDIFQDVGYIIGIMGKCLKLYVRIISTFVALLAWLIT